MRSTPNLIMQTEHAKYKNGLGYIAYSQIKLDKVELETRETTIKNIVEGSGEPVHENLRTQTLISDLSYSPSR